MQKDPNAAFAEAWAKAEQHFPQFLEFVSAQNELITSDTCLLTGATYHQDYEQYLQLVSHDA